LKWRDRIGPTMVIGSFSSLSGRRVDQVSCPAFTPGSDRSAPWGGRRPDF
jgi:hypothetical protein